MSVAQTIGAADRPLSTQIYESLREAIIEGRIAPGSRLREQALADEFDVSRVPLREAIPQLEAEGFVRTLPRRGTVVTQLTMRDVSDLFDIRERLEVLAARLSAQQSPHGDPAVLAQIEDCQRRARAALRSGSNREVTATSAEFHALVVELSGNALLRTMMRPVNGRARWVFRMTSARDPKVACRTHDRIFKAIRTGEVELAEQLMFEHIASGRQPSIDILKGMIPDG